MTASRVTTYLRQLHYHIPCVEPITDVILRSNLKLRKAILVLTRCQRIPPLAASSTTDYIYHKLALELETIIFRRGESSTLHQLLSPHAHLFRSTVISGLINMLVRNLPLQDQDEYREEIQTGIQKELFAAVSKYHPAIFNWDYMLSLPLDRSRHKPREFHPDYHLDYDMHRSIAFGFLRSKAVLERMIFYPSYSNKTVGMETTRDYSRVAMEVQDEEINLSKGSTREMEVIYSRTGYEVQGMTEMRWAMKYTDLKPRPYYARGGDHYFASRYIQQVFNKLVDLFPVTHRRMRFLTTNIRCTDTQSFFIYDYTSFTSTLHEVNNFLRALARYFSDLEITVIDTAQGEVQINLGEYLANYVESCNMWSSFDVGQANPEKVYVGDLFLLHNTGMLGVPGNISSCTLLHGLHLSIMLQSLILCRCIGDDAIGLTDEDPLDLVPFLQNIGLINEDKTVPFGPEDDGMDIEEEFCGKVWNYEKRFIRRVAGRVVQRYELMFPPIAIILGFESDYHTIIDCPVRERLRKMEHTLNSLWLSCDETFFQATDLEREVLIGFVYSLYHSFQRIYRRTMEGKGRLDMTRIRRHLTVLVTGPLGREYFDHWFSCKMLGELVKLPVPFTYATFPNSLDDAPVIGEPHVVRGHPLWKLCKDMGWASYVQREELVFVEYCHYNRVRDFFFGDTVASFDLTLNDSIPAHIMTTIQNRFCLSEDPIVEDSDSSIVSTAGSDTE